MVGMRRASAVGARLAHGSVPRFLPFVLFLTSLPICLAFFRGFPQAMELGGALGEGVVSFFNASALAAMFVALAMLFICLLKTAYARMGRRLVYAGGGAYLAGHALLLAALALPGSLAALFSVAGAFLGLGAAVMCLAWALRARWLDFRRSFMAVVAAFCVAVAVHAVLALVESVVAVQACLAVLAVLGIAGSWWELRTPVAEDAPVTADEAGSNWWDIFSRLDVSVVPGGDEYAAPLPRALFFVVSPLLVLLLLAVNASVAPDEGDVGVALAASVLTAVGALPLFAAKTGRGIINLAFRIYLPALAFVAVSVAAFLDVPRAAVLHVGVQAYCMLYALLFAALLLSASGCMRSLALPCMSLLVLVASMALLLIALPQDAGQVLSLQPVFMFGCLVASVLLMMVTPGARIWSVMMEDLLPFEPAASLGDWAVEDGRALAREHELTGRETEVFLVLMRGHGSAYIAKSLGVSESTVRSHRTNIYRKLGVASREELLALIEERSRDAARASGKDAASV